MSVSVIYSVVVSDVIVGLHAYDDVIFTRTLADKDITVGHGLQ